MAAPVVSRATPPALAERLREVFPELDGRAVAVSETLSLQTTKPEKYPLMLAYTMGEAVSSAQQFRPRTLVEQVVVELWQAAKPYKDGDDQGAPIFRFYDHTLFRDRLVSGLIGWETPAGGRLEMTALSMDILHINQTVAFVVTFEHEFRWCEPPGDRNGLVPIEAVRLNSGAFDRCAHVCACDPPQPACATCAPLILEPCDP